MNKLPLLPSTTARGIPASLDVSSDIQSSFRKLLETSVQKCIKRMKTVSVKKVIGEYNRQCSEIMEAERQLLILKGKELLKKDEKTCGIPNVEEFPKKHIEKYNLISANDVLEELNNKMKNVFGQMKNEDTSSTDLILKSIQDKKKLRAEKNKNSPMRIRLRKEKLENSKVERKPEADLSYKKETIMFTEFYTGKTFTKTWSVRNISPRSSYNFKVVSPKQPKIFEIEWKCQNSINPRILLPFMSLKITIFFHCTSYEDQRDYFEICIKDGEVIRIDLYAKRASPILMSEDYLRCERNKIRKKKRCLSLPIDCGSHLVGSESVTTIKLFNAGSDGTFFILSEISWLYSQVKNYSDDGAVQKQPFSIYPAFFSVRKNSSVDLAVTFKPEIVSINTEKFFILCDNHTIQELDLIGYALMYKPDSLQFVGLEKSSSIDIEDSAQGGAKYYLDLGKTLTTGCVKKKFEICNLGEVMVNFHWEMQATFIEGTFPMPDDCLRIIPSTGYICPEAGQSFLVHCCIDYMKVGHFRANICLVIDHLPRQSILEINEDKIIEEYNKNVSVYHEKIEVWVEIQEPNVELSQYYTTFSAEPQSIQERDLIIFNQSHGDINTAWLNNEIGLMNIVPKPVLTNSQVHFIVSLCPLKEGHVNSILRCEVDKQEMALDITIEGNIETGELLIESAITDFGSVKLNNDPLVSVYVLKLPKAQDTISVREILYDHSGFIEKVLPEAVPEKQQVKGDSTHCVNTTYILDFSWEMRSSSAFSILIGEILMPTVSLKSPFINIANPLYASIQLNMYVKLKNHTCLNNSFKWGEAAGQITEKLSAIAKPENGILYSGEQIRNLIILCPKLEGNIDEFDFPCEIDLMRNPLVLSLQANILELSILIKWQSDNIKGSQKIVIWPLEISKSAPIREILTRCSESEKNTIISKYQERCFGMKIKSMTCVTRTIIIKNLSPIETSFSVSVETFYERNKPTGNISHRSPSYWKSKIQDGYTIVISISPLIGKLNGNEEVKLVVSVYAKAWGTYFDTITIGIGKLPKFHLPVIIDVKGVPAHFTFAPGTSNPTFRFRTTVVKGTDEHKVTLCNNSAIPLKICWATYVINGERSFEETLTRVKPDFSLLLETGSPNESDFFRIHIIEFIGRENSIIYKISPLFVYLQPYEKVDIRITVDSRSMWFNSNEFLTLLKGAAVGFVYIDHELMPKSYFKRCYRPSGYDLGPIILRLITKFQIPTLCPVNIVREDTRFKVTANEILESKMEVYRKKRTYCFKNITGTRVTIGVKIGHPFYVSELRLAKDIITCKKDFLAEVAAGQIIEVEVELMLCPHDLFGVGSNNFKSGSKVSEHINYHYQDIKFLQSSLVIYQKDYQAHQGIDLQIEIILPAIILSTKRLLFGPVFLNDTKCLIFSIISYCTDGEPFEVLGKCEGDESALEIEPSKGTLYQGESTDIIVKFTPRRNKSYIGTITIQTLIPNRFEQLAVEGVGTWNRKYHYDY